MRGMSADSTRWTVVRDAARGCAASRAEFARRYEPVIRAYLGARWRGTPLLGELGYLGVFEDGVAMFPGLGQRS